MTAEHSLEVAYIAHALGIINNTIYEGHLNAERMAVLGMYHDVTEIITGDMPTPVKYYSTEIRNAYKELENVAKNQLLTGLLRLCVTAMNLFFLKLRKRRNCGDMLRRLIRYRHILSV